MPGSKVLDLVSGTPAGVWTTSNYTWTIRGTLNVATDIVSVRMKSSVTSSWTGKAVVYRVSDGVKLGEGTAASTAMTANTWIDFPLNAVVQVPAGTEVAIGVNGSGTSGPGFLNTGTAAGTVTTSTPSGISFTRTQVGTWINSSGDAVPNTQQTGNDAFLGFTAEISNLSPTMTASSPTQTYVNPLKDITLTWAYSDPEATPQASAEVSWRELGDPNAAWSAAVTITGTGTTYTLPAGTWTLGKKYVWRVRGSDGNTWSGYRENAVDASGYSTVSGTTATSYTYPALSFPDDGSYELQARVANSKGYGPWSAVETFTVVSTNRYYYNGTAWVAAPTSYYNGSAWVAAI